MFLLAKWVVPSMSNRALAEKSSGYNLKLKEKKKKKIRKKYRTLLADKCSSVVVLRMIWRGKSFTHFFSLVRKCRWTCVNLVKWEPSRCGQAREKKSSDKLAVPASPPSMHVHHTITFTLNACPSWPETDVRPENLRRALIDLSLMFVVR